ncbi:MAG: ClpX C4-type zinc finger protein [Phycisphaerales bacterium]
MRREGTNEEDVKMGDVLCDFCHRGWSEDQPMLEGHQGSCICGRCLTVAYREVVLSGTTSGIRNYTCPMCLEGEFDREALGRIDEPSWQSPAWPDAVICRRCIKLAAGALHKDPDYQWKKPQPEESA